MKYVFWGSMHGQPGTTSNALAVSIYSCAAYQHKVAILQSHFSMNNLSYPLIGVSEGTGSFRDTGIDALLRDYKSKPLTEDVIRSDCMSMLSKQYSLFSGTGNRNEEAFEKEMLVYFNAITDEIEKYNDSVFIDIASGYSKLSKKIAMDADVLIVNLSQNRHVIEEYFDNEIKHDNIVYLFGNYNCNSKYNIHNLTRLYPQLKHKCYCIYYNVDFMDAQNDGKMIEYMIKNINCPEYSASYDFMQSVKSISDMLKGKGDAIANN